jgi:uncharacterized protein (DUF983 family)
MAVPVRVDLRLGRLGRADPRVNPVMAATEPKPVAAALAGLCPRCGSKSLFEGWVKLASECSNCCLDYSAFNVGDGPAAFLILIIGAVLTIGALIVDAAWSPLWFVHLIWIPIGAALTILGLRLGKAFLLGQEYRHRAREGRIVR